MILICIFLMTCDVEHLSFHVLICHPDISSGEVTLQTFYYLNKKKNELLIPWILYFRSWQNFS